jgi:uncharacterized membrane protein YecN with MAPEG domain
MPVPITAFYAALLTLIAIVLTQFVGQARLAAGVALGDGGNSTLLVAMRRHANFTEHVPLALILLALIELNGAGAALMHSLGIVLVASRIVHPFGLHHEDMRRKARLIGALGTLLVSVVAAAVAGYQGFTAL